MPTEPVPVLSSLADEPEREPTQVRGDPLMVPPSPPQPPPLAPSTDDEAARGAEVRSPFRSEPELETDSDGPDSELDDRSTPTKRPILGRSTLVVDAERHLIAPVQRMMGRRPRVRKVTRVVRHVDPWTVFKVAAVFSMVLYGVMLTAGVLLWNVAHTTGTIENLEQWMESFGWESFEFSGGQIYRASWVAGLFGAIGLTGLAVLGATLFNLITDLVGGVRFTVLEEEVVEKTTSPMKRFTVRHTDETGETIRPPEATEPEDDAAATAGTSGSGDRSPSYDTSL